MFNGMNGLEILNSWPRYESGELVRFVDDVSRNGGDFEANVIALYRDGSFSLNFWAYAKGERARRPAVLAADGEPLEVGQTVWDADGMEFRVESFDSNGVWGAWKTDDGWIKAHPCPTLFTHQRPVLDADGVPIRKGDTVWHVETGEQCKVVEVDSRSVSVDFRVDGDGTKHTGSILPANLTHRAPVLAADGRPLREGDTVWDTDAEEDTPLTVVEVSSDLVRCEYTWKDGKTYRPCYPPDQLTHTKPEVDTWQRIEEDALNFVEDNAGMPHDQDQMERDMLAILRRCRALAERERGE